jgi:phosphoribosylformimino-5-aminoimidazole carboxamide ribotide isomerase
MPSIDIHNGKTVRVVKGIPELNSKDYGDDPVEMAMIWRAENAKCIHVVDFNASWEHSHYNFDIIKKICNSVIIPVEYGGGIHTFEDAKNAIELGVFRLVIGTMAHEKPDDFKKVIDTFGTQIISAAMDVVNEQVVIKGRSSNTKYSPEDYALYLKDLGVNRIIVTDVNRNGMMAGPNVELCNKVAKTAKVKVTLSGGIGGYPDLKRVMNEAEKEIDSVIIGRALYENKFPCQKIWRVAESGIFN